MEILKYETSLKCEIIEMRCRDSCPCNCDFREFSSEYLPSPDKLS